MENTNLHSDVQSSLYSYIKIKDTLGDKWFNIDSCKIVDTTALYPFSYKPYSICSSLKHNLELFMKWYTTYLEGIVIHAKLNDVSKPECKYLNLSTKRWIMEERLAAKKGIYKNDKYMYFATDKDMYDDVTSILNFIDKCNRFGAGDSVKSSTTRSKKQPITKQFKSDVWDKYHTDIDGSCFSCSKILTKGGTWHCGHICSETRGGEMKLDNMVVLCGKCNKSMGVQSLWMWMIANNKNTRAFETNPSFIIFKQIHEMKHNCIHSITKLVNSKVLTIGDKTRYIQLLNSPSTTIDATLQIFDTIKHLIDIVSNHTK